MKPVTVARLTSSTGGLNVINGTYYFLNATGNGLGDKLYGGAGMDWFFAGMADVFFNKTSGETVTLI